MMDVTDDRALAVRTRRVRGGMAFALAAALFGGFLLVLLIEPGSGVQDVHLPSAGRHLLGAHRSLLATDEPWVVGRGIGRLPQMLARALHIASLGAVPLVLWALIKRKKVVGWSAIGFVATMGAAGPIPTTMQPEPPVAVSAETAARLLASEPGEATPWRRYMLAQIALAHGDRSAAAGLARGLDPDDLQSPIEAPYRLQYLRGGPITTTSTCFAFGCLDPTGRRQGQAIALILLVGGIAAGAGAGWLGRLLRDRGRRIERLRALRLDREMAT